MLLTYFCNLQFASEYGMVFPIFLFSFSPQVFCLANQFARLKELSEQRIRQRELGVPKEYASQAREVTFFCSREIGIRIQEAMCLFLRLRNSYPSLFSISHQSSISFNAKWSCQCLGAYCVPGKIYM